jgi:hypothetical protein
MGDIEMVGGEGVPKPTGEFTIQHGGGHGSIDMRGGSGLTLSHTPVSSVQQGGSKSGIDMVGPQGLFSQKPVSPYGAKYPSDKGKV